jgi:5-methylcytosine-specific restriction protein A
MPYKPKRGCAYPGCARLTYRCYCEQHEPLMTRQYNHYLRDPATAKRYGAAWKKTRAAYLAANPLCVICQRNGRLTPAALVHHKIKLSDGGTNDWTNLMSLCDACHSRLHAEQGDYF